MNTSEDTLCQISPTPQQACEMRGTQELGRQHHSCHFISLHCHLAVTVTCSWQSPAGEQFVSHRKCLVEPGNTHSKQARLPQSSLALSQGTGHGQLHARTPGHRIIRHRCSPTPTHWGSLKGPCVPAVEVGSTNTKFHNLWAHVPLRNK
jgi:hypothetical protein